MNLKQYSLSESEKARLIQGVQAALAIPMIDSLEDLAIYAPQDLFWKWTDTTRTGLQGIRKSDNFCVYRWYPNQKQFFERFRLHKDSFIFQLKPKRVDLEEIIAFLNERIANTH